MLSFRRAALFFTKGINRMDRMMNFKLACKNYLQTVNIATLRSYGRALGLGKPTVLRKAELIDQILLVLCGEIAPERKKLGAPVKSDYVNPALTQRIQELRAEYLQEGERVAQKKSSKREDEEVVLQPLSLHFSIEFSTLTKLQKSRLTAFLKTL